MESIYNENNSEGKVEKTTLKGYYESLPRATYPKTDLINEIAVETGVSATSVRNWIYYGMTPANELHKKIINRIISRREGKTIDVW